MNIYNSFLPWGKSIVYSTFGTILQIARYGKKFRKLEDEAKKREGLSISEIQKYQLQKLKDILIYAAEKVPYYKKVFTISKIIPENINSFEDLHKIQIISKNEVQANLKMFQSIDNSLFKTRIISTSGSTGTGLQFPITFDAERQLWAIIWRYRKRFKVDHNNWCAQFFGRYLFPVTQRKPPFWIVNIPGKQIFFSAYHLTDNNLSYYIKELNNRQPELITGYPSLLTQIAQYILNTGDKLSYTPHFIGTSSETLLDFQRNIIEKGFQTECHQHYGQTENVSLISECTKGVLHVDEDFGYIEFIPFEENNYKMIATGFSNHAFPLIRYDTDDTVQLYDYNYQCSCGLPGRVVKSIDGRVEDYIIKPDGTKVSCLNQIFKDIQTVKNAQIIQKKIDEIVINIVPNPQFNKKYEKMVVKQISKYVGSDISYKCDIVDEIPCLKNGKHRFVVSEIL